MKKLSILSIAIFLFFALAISAQAQTPDDVAAHKSCGQCGMDRGMFDYSRMLIEYDDGTVAPFCSLHCAAVSMAYNIDKTPKSIKVADFNGKQLIDAESAFWVIGGTKPGVMSKRGKWAFEKKADAEAFMATNKGTLGGFEDAMKAAYEDMYTDTKMIREKRKMKRMNMTAPMTNAGH
jgi:copper chaperone NosL